MPPGCAGPTDQPERRSAAVFEWDCGVLDPAGHPALTALASTEGVAEEREAGQVDVDVDGVFARGHPDDVDQPGVERLAVAGRELLGFALHRLRDPEGDPGQ